MAAAAAAAGRDQRLCHDLIRAHDAQFAAVLHAHRERVALRVGGDDLELAVALERGARPTHLVLTLVCAAGEQQHALHTQRQLRRAEANA